MGNASPDLAQRGADARARLDALREQRASALLAGVPFDHQQFSALEAEIEALADAEVAASAADRDKRADATTSERARVMMEVGEVERDRLALLQQLDDAAGAYDEAIEGIDDAVKRQLALWRQLGEATPEHLYNQQKRIGLWRERSGVWDPMWAPPWARGKSLTEVERIEGEKAIAVATRKNERK
jgi:hypothetical protein